MLPSLASAPLAHSLLGVAVSIAGLGPGASAADLDGYDVVASPEGWAADNPGQRWRTTFDGRGFTTRPHEGGWSWGLELESYGFRGSQRDATQARFVHTEGGTTRYDRDDVLQEWFVNDGRGLEHGFTLLAPPSASDEARDVLAFDLSVRGSLRPDVSSDGRCVLFSDEDGAVALTYAGLVVFDAEGRELEASFLRVGERLRLAVNACGARYPLTIDPVAQQAYLKASNTGFGDAFGHAISVSGDTLVVGAPGERSSSAGVDGDQSDDSLGSAGAAYVFVRNGTTWSQQAYLKASNPGSGDSFGSAVAISGDTLVVGANGERSAATGVDGDQTDDSLLMAGAAYVFVRDGTTWSQQAYLKASNTGQGDNFGEAVGISGDTIVVGAADERSGATGIDGDGTDDGTPFAGAAYVFARSGTTWSQEAYLKASNTGMGDQFGWSVAATGDTVVVSAFAERSAATGVDGDETDDSAPRAGAVYVFVRSAATWSQEAYLKASNSAAFDDFGYSVAAEGDTILVGALGEDSGATGVDGDETDDGALDSGAAYVFARSGSTWSQQAYLKASNTDAGDDFGWSTVLSGELALVGARSEQSAATGVDGDSSSDAAFQAGAAYLFRRVGSSWSQDAYLKASNTDVGDRFGEAVGVSAGTLAVSARCEASGATGVDGDQDDDSVGTSGAVYAFVACDPSPPGETVRTGTPPNPTALLPGQTTGPVLGGTWDPVVDHTTFFPTASFDVLAVSLAPPIELPTPFGQLLCTLPPPSLVFVVPAGTPFGVAIPFDCSFSGTSVCTQAASLSVGPLTLHLTNAIDVVLGTQ